MFESTELDRIGKMEIERNELKSLILSINPRNVISKYVNAKRNYRAAKKSGTLNKKIQAEFIDESKKIASILNIDDINEIITKPNTTILSLIEGNTDFAKLDLLKDDFKIATIKLNKYKDRFNGQKTEGNNKNRLFADSKNVLEYYSNKMPQISVLDEQINILNVERRNYLSNGLRDMSKKCDLAISELETKKQKVKNTFNNINKQKTKAEIAEINAILEKDEKYNELKSLKREIKSELLNNSASKIVEKLKLTKSSYDSIIIDLDNPTEIESDYYEQINKIAELLDISTTEVKSMSTSAIYKSIRELKLTEHLNDKLDTVNVEMTMIKSKISDNYSTEDMLYDIFDYENDDTSGKIPKDILIASNIKKAESYVSGLCYKLDQYRNYDDALSGGLIGLTLAVNAWYDKQKPLDSGLRFSDFFGRYVYHNAQKALHEIAASGSTSGSNAGTLLYKERLLREEMDKRVKLYIEQNPNMVNMKHQLIEELLMQDAIENGKKNIIRAVSETDYNAIIGSQGESADMWSLNSYDKQTFTNDELLDGKQNYNYLLKSINKLMNLFDVKEKSGFYVVNEERKLMDIYDRQIFLMRTGLDFKKTKAEVDGNKLRDKYSLREIADEIAEMKRANGVTNAKISEAAILARWQKMIMKLKVAIEMNPEIKAGLEYMLKYIDDNQNLMRKMSNYREEIATKTERDKLKTSYVNNAEVLDIEMLDGKKLGDDYQIATDNSLGDIDINI